MKGIRIAALATAAVVIVGSLFVPVRAQRPVVSAELPATVEALIFELANSMGMLRGRSNQETRSRDSILTLEHWASGSLAVGQERFDIPEYRMSLNFSYPGMRLDFTLAEPAGASERRIEVVSGDAAWNETERVQGALEAVKAGRRPVVLLAELPVLCAEAKLAVERTLESRDSLRDLE